MLPFQRARQQREGSALQVETGLLPGPDALVSAPFGFFECGPDDSVGALDRGGGVMLFDEAETSVLQALRLPCLQKDLARRLQKQGWDQDDLGGAARIIERLLARGCLNRLDRLVDSARIGMAKDAAVRVEGPGLGLLAIPTRDRPETLDRALRAWSAGLVEEGSLPDIMVADDSVIDARSSRKVAESFSSAYPGTVLFLDRTMRVALAEALAPTGDRAAAFALGVEGGPASLSRYGAARNFILLASAGRAVAMADDDMLPEFRLHPGAFGGLALSSEPDPTKLRPFEDIGELEKWLVPSHDAIEVPHRLLLGRSSRELLLEAGMLDLGRADAATLDSAFGAADRIAALCFGTWGDSGIPANRYLLGLRNLVDAGSPDIYEAGHYRTALEGRMVFRSPLCATLGGKVFMGGHIALDSRSLLPPFSPSGRDEDGLWGFCLGILHQDCLVAYPAQAALHKPPDARVSKREDALRWDHCLNETLRVVMGLLASRHENGEGAYASLGGRLRAVASGQRQEFRQVLAESSARSIAARIGILERALAEYGGEPATWAVDVESAIAALVVRLEAPKFWLPRELEALDQAEAEAVLSGYLLRFGELLQAWPSMFVVATKIGPEVLERARIGL